MWRHRGAHTRPLELESVASVDTEANSFSTDEPSSLPDTQPPVSPHDAVGRVEGAAAHLPGAVIAHHHRRDTSDELDGDKTAGFHEVDAVSEPALRQQQQAVGHRRAPRRVAKASKPYPRFVIGMTISQTLMLVYAMILAGGVSDLASNPWLGPDVDTLILLGARYNPPIRAGEWWRLVTPVLLHTGLFHLAMNVVFQIRVGIALEQCYGAARLAAAYIICAVSGNLMSGIFLPQDVSVGASSALFGQVGFMIVDAVRLRHLGHQSRRHMFMMLAITLISLVFGMIPGVDNFSHLGGLLAGLLLGASVLPVPARPPDSKQHVVPPLREILLFSLLLLAWLLLLLLVFLADVDAPSSCPACMYLNCVDPLGYHWCPSPTSLSDHLFSMPISA